MERAIWRVLIVAGLAMTIAGHIAAGMLSEASGRGPWLSDNAWPLNVFVFSYRVGLTAAALGAMGLWLQNSAAARAGGIELHEVNLKPEQVAAAISPKRKRGNASNR